MLALYDRAGPLLRAVALRVTSDRVEAEDVVQDVLLRAWREAAHFDRAKGSGLTWLVTLTRNRAIDAVRARRRRDDRAGEGALLAEAGLFEVGTQSVATPEEASAVAERAVAVRHALATLTRDQRAALDLAYFHGMSHSEIAAALAQPLGTVKTRILQAVRKLREQLGTHDDRAPAVAPADAER